MISVELTETDILIRMPIEDLKIAAEFSNYFDNSKYNGTVLEVDDPEAFAESVVEALTVEEEDGQTLLIQAFDKAFEYVAEQGLDGLSQEELI